MFFLQFLGIGEQNIAYITADREKLQQALNHSTSGKYSCFIHIPTRSVLVHLFLVLFNVLGLLCSNLGLWMNGWVVSFYLVSYSN